MSRANKHFWGRVSFLGIDPVCSWDPSRGPDHLERNKNTLFAYLFSTAKMKNSNKIFNVNCVCLVLYYFVLWLASITRATFSSNDKQIKTNRNRRRRSFSRAWHRLHVIASNSDWLIVSVVIGSLALLLQQSIEKRSNSSNRNRPSEWHGLDEHEATRQLYWK